MEKRPLFRDGFRFWLRPCDAGDGPALFEAADESRQRVGQWMDWLTDMYSMADASAWVQDAADDWGRGDRCEFVIIDSTDGRLAGCCGLNRINPKDLVCNLGYWVCESKIRNGAAFEAGQLLREFGHRELGLVRIEIVVADGNTPSRRVAEKLGAVYEGLQRLRIRLGNHSHDAHMYVLLDRP